MSQTAALHKLLSRACKLESISLDEQTQEYLVASSGEMQGRCYKLLSLLQT
ncbi:MAG: hypothetical protein Q9M40_05400 [Sulfurimonas sp.]|nr:hypothetical protein [Sulfurimonas sp.]